MQYTPQGDAALAGAATLEYPRQIFSGHSDWVQDLAFSPDHRYLLTGSVDKTARLWDAQTGQELRACLQRDHAIYKGRSEAPLYVALPLSTYSNEDQVFLMHDDLIDYLIPGSWGIPRYE